MGLLSSLRRRGNQPASLPQGLWRRGDFMAVALGLDGSAVRRNGGPVCELPAFLVEFIEEYEEFEPLEVAVARHAERHHWDSLQARALLAALPESIAAGLLVSTEGLRQAWAKGAAEEEPPARIGTIGVSTGGARLPMLERCIRSFAGNLREHGRGGVFLVSENSRAPEQTAQTRAAVRAWSTDFPGIAFRFAGERERRELIAHLGQAEACSPEVAEFALFDPLGSGFSCGANRNALLLQTAGEMLASLDDDVVCRLAGPPLPARAELACFSETDPYSRWLHPDRAATLVSAPWETADYLGAHETLLGRRSGALWPAEDATDFSRTSDVLVRRLLSGPTRVRASYTGHAGDPGIPTSAYYLYYDGENRERLTESPAHYRSVFGSRSVLTISPEAALGDASVCPGMAMGLDHRELLPPFFPILHAEDFSYGAALWQCCPDALFGHLPLAVYHEPGEGKPILTPADLRQSRPFVLFEFAHLLRQIILRGRLPEHGTAAERTGALGRCLKEIGRLPAADFHEVLRGEALDQASHRVAYLARQLEQNPDLPGYWRDDVEALITHLRDSVSAPDFEIPLDLQSDRTPPENRAFMQRAIGLYGRLLTEWPGMVEAARRLRESGPGFMQPA